MKAALVLLAFSSVVAASATDPSKQDVAPTGKVSVADPVGEQCRSRLDLRIVSSADGQSYSLAIRRPLQCLPSAESGEWRIHQLELCVAVMGIRFVLGGRNICNLPSVLSNVIKC